MFTSPGRSRQVVHVILNINLTWTSNGKTLKTDFNADASIYAYTQQLMFEDLVNTYILAAEETPPHFCFPVAHAISYTPPSPDGGGTRAKQSTITCDKHVHELFEAVVCFAGRNEKADIVLRIYVGGMISRSCF